MHHLSFLLFPEKRRPKEKRKWTLNEQHYLSEINYLLFIYLCIGFQTTHLVFCALPVLGLTHVLYSFLYIHSWCKCRGNLREPRPSFLFLSKTTLFFTPLPSPLLSISGWSACPHRRLHGLWFILVFSSLLWLAVYCPHSSDTIFWSPLYTALGSVQTYQVTIHTELFWKNAVCFHLLPMHGWDSSPVRHC